ncbi:MAG: hypothetical protein V1847_05505 [Candidatus Diapherotrites archaeon]
MAVRKPLNPLAAKRMKNLGLWDRRLRDFDGQMKKINMKQPGAGLQKLALAQRRKVVLNALVRIATDPSNFFVVRKKAAIILRNGGYVPSKDSRFHWRNFKTKP